MTCIVGLRHPGGVTIGGDSGGFSGWDVTVRSDTKVFVRGPYLIGFTTSYRMGQILRYAPLPDPTPNLHEFLCTDFVDALRAALRTGGFLESDKGRDSGGTFLLGVQGRLFEVSEDFQIGEPEDGFAACGCGWQYAVATLALLPKRLSPAKRVEQALQLAERFNAGVRGPFVIRAQRHG